MKIPSIFINLKRSSVRNQKMIEQLNLIKAEYYRIDAIDSQNIKKNNILNGTVENYSYFVKNDIVLKPREKEIAIILSHMKALNFICENNIEIAVIMEDDNSFQYIYNWDEQINDIINNAPNNWKIIKLHTSSSKSVKQNIELLNKNIYYTSLTDSAMNGASCYIIKKSTAREILDKYLVNNIYTFPYKKEYVVCECIIFSLSDIYMYTKPIICTLDNNITCAGNYNQADRDTNEIIYNYWKNENENKSELCVKNYNEKPQKYNIIPIKNIILKNKK